MPTFVFDLDDTLYLERRFAESGYRCVAEQFRNRLGDPLQTFALMCQQLDGPNRRRVFDATLEALGMQVDPVLRDAMIAAYRAHSPNIALCPDAERALTRLAGQPSGLITDGPAAVQQRKVEALGLPSRIRAIVLTDALGPGFGKPHPRAFEAVAAMLGEAHCDCVYVADNPAKDFVAPNRLGWQTVQIVRDGGFYVGEVPPVDGAPQRVIHSLDAL